MIPVFIANHLILLLMASISLWLGFGLIISGLEPYPITGSINASKKFIAMKKNYMMVLLLFASISVYANRHNKFYNYIKSTPYNTTTQNNIPTDLIGFIGNYQNGKDLLQWVAPYDATVKNFEVERSTNGDIFYHLDNVAPQGRDVGTQYQYHPFTTVTGVRYYRLRTNYVDGSYQYSAIIKIDDDMDKRIVVRYNGTKQLQLSLPYYLKQINVVNASGQVLRRYTDLNAGIQVINMDNLQGGIYWLQCMNDHQFQNIEVNLAP